MVFANKASPEPVPPKGGRTAPRLIVIPILVLALLPFIANLQTHTQTALASPVVSPTLARVAGNEPTLVILVQFSDQPNSTAPSQISQTLAGVNNYYAEDSYGLVSFTTTITPTTSEWFTLHHGMSYYSSGTAAADTQLVTDSLDAAYSAGVDLHQFKFAIVVHSGSDEAITRAQTDIHSYTIPGYVFSPSPLASYQISTSVVSESDPLGVYCHEAGHLLGLPDLYDLTQQIDPTSNFVGYWDIMALGEWNPNNGHLPAPGTYPAQHSSWSKIRLGWITNSTLRTVYPGNETTINLQNLELPTTGVQAVRIPIVVNSDGSLSYYLAELRARLGTYDQYLPIPSTYPGEALLIYKVNESIAPGHGNLLLVNAHPRGDLRDAGFGPCGSPCVSNNTFWDQADFVKIIVTATSPTAFTIVVDRTSSPLLLLQINTPSPGMFVSVDGENSTSDQSSELRLPVHLGPHEISVETQAPVSLGGTNLELGLTDSFAAWSDGSTSNPRWVSVIKDTVMTATFRVVVGPSFATAGTAAIILAVVVAGVSMRRARLKRNLMPSIDRRSHRLARASDRSDGLFPGNDRPGDETVNRDDKAQNT